MEKRYKIIDAILNNDRAALYEAVTGKSQFPEYYCLIGANEAIVSIENNEGDTKPVYNENGRVWSKDGKQTTLKVAKKYTPPLLWLQIMDSEKELKEKLNNIN